MADSQPSPPSEGSGAAAVAPAKPQARPSNQTKQLPPYNVVLLDDDHHTYAYVIEMLVALFAYDEQKAFKLAKEVDTRGRVILMTTHKEKAELKRDQITAYGADFRMSSSQGSMSAVIEPAPS